MAGKTRNRIELRRQHEAAEPIDPMEDDTDADAPDEVEEAPKPKRSKAKAAPKKPRATKAAKPSARMRIVWQVVNDAFKVVGTFEYSQRDAAEAKAAEMIAKGKGNHFIQKVKEAMPDDAPGLGASIPRTPAAPKATASKPAARGKAKAVVEDEEIEDEEEEDEEEEEEDDDE